MGNLKLKELEYDGKSIKDDFHKIVLFDKNHRLIRYNAINKYAESCVIEQKEVSLYSEDNQFIEKVLQVVIEKVCINVADLDALPPIRFGEDEHIPKPISVGEPAGINHDDSKIKRVTIDEFIPEKVDPTIHFDKKVLESGLSFKEAYMHMVEGKKIARPCFMGWWFMNHESKVIIHDRYANELKEGDITNTVTNTLANDWEVIE